jgi:hypothetical protein
VKTLRAPFFELLPTMRAHPVVRYRGRLHGRFKVIVRIRPERGVASGPRAPDLAPVERTFRIRL